MRLVCAVLWCLAATALAVLAHADPAPMSTRERLQKAPFEAKIAAFEAADKKSPPPAGAVLFVGSSSIGRWKTLARDFPELTVINRGIDGSQIADTDRFADRIVIPYKPKIIVLYAGTNDINAGKTPARVLKDFQDFAAKVQAALPDTRIVYISINPSVLRWKQEDKFVEANRLIEGFVRGSGQKASKLSFIDSHSKLLGPEGKPRPEILQPDGLHPNAKGYEEWTAILKPPLLALLAADTK